MEQTTQWTCNNLPKVVNESGKDKHIARWAFQHFIYPRLLVSTIKLQLILLSRCYSFFIACRMAPGKKGNQLLPVNHLTKPQQDLTQSSKQLSEWDEIEEEYCAKACDSLVRALIQQPDVAMPSTSAATDNLHAINKNEGFYGFNYVQPDTPPYDESDSGTESDDYGPFLVI